MLVGRVLFLHDVDVNVDMYAGVYGNATWNVDGDVNVCMYGDAGMCGSMIVSVGVDTDVYVDMYTDVTVDVYVYVYVYEC